MNNTNSNQSKASCLKLEEVGISDYQNPFGNCKLNRKQEGDVLTSLINNYKDGFTMAINGSWGSGKTTFIKMWQQDLKNKGHETILLNAWENDFVSEPLVAILGELEQVFSSQKSNFEKFKERAIPFMQNLGKSILPTLTSVVIEKLAGESAKDFIKELAKEAIQVTVNEFSKEISEYQVQKASIASFREALSELVATLDKKPLVFIIDELDRCRPNYAVELLEKIKHFFSVDGIVFVLAIDKEQLSASVRGHYGSDTLNAEEYLRRFIDLEYTLKEPHIESFCNYLYDKMGFAKFFETLEQEKFEIYRFGHYVKEYAKDIFLLTAINLFSSKRLKLRQIEKLYGQITSSLSLIDKDIPIYADILLYLAYIKLYRPIFYNKIVGTILTVKDFEKGLLEIFPNINSDDPRRSIDIHCISRLVYFYNNSLLPHMRKIDLLIPSNEIQISSIPNLKYFNSEAFYKYLNHLSQEEVSKDFSLKQITDVLDLIPVTP